MSSYGDTPASALADKIFSNTPAEILQRSMQSAQTILSHPDAESLAVVGNVGAPAELWEINLHRHSNTHVHSLCWALDEMVAQEMKRPAKDHPFALVLTLADGTIIEETFEFSHIDLVSTAGNEKIYAFFITFVSHDGTDFHVILREDVSRSTVGQDPKDGETDTKLYIGGYQTFVVEDGADPVAVRKNPGNAITGLEFPGTLIATGAGSKVEPQRLKCDYGLIQVDKEEIIPCVGTIGEDGFIVQDHILYQTRDPVPLVNEATESITHTNFVRMFRLLRDGGYYGEQSELDRGTGLASLIEKETELQGKMRLARGTDDTKYYTLRPAGSPSSALPDIEPALIDLAQRTGLLAIFDKVIARGSK